MVDAPATQARVQVALVALGLELLGELRAALLDDLAGHEDVHEVRLDVAQDPRVVGDQQQAGLAGRADPVDALADHPQRVDVEAGVGLVEDRDLRLEQLELHDLVPLLLAAGEALVDVALGERRVHVQLLHRAAQLAGPGAQLRRLAVDRGLRGTQEVRHRHAGDLDRVLHGQEQAGAGPLVDGHRQHVLAVQRDRAAGDLVLRVARDGVRQGGLAGAVRAHDGVRLARLHGQVDPGEDRLQVALGQLDRHLQVADLQGAHGITPLLGVEET